MGLGTLRRHDKARGITPPPATRAPERFDHDEHKRILQELEAKHQEELEAARSGSEVHADYEAFKARTLEEIGEFKKKAAERLAEADKLLEEKDARIAELEAELAKRAEGTVLEGDAPAGDLPEIDPAKPSEEKIAPAKSEGDEKAPQTSGKKKK